MSADAQWVRPTDTELDMFGLTHIGRVRKENQDHFMLCTVHPQVVVHGTSLPDPASLPLRGERIATYMLVADGVGSGSGGGEASRVALATITQYVASSMRSYHSAGAASDTEFYQALTDAALEAHTAVKKRQLLDPDAKMATTLTLAVAVFPWMYVTQVGDSRCYIYWQGKLNQITRDQTLAQGLADQGILPADRVSSSPLSHVLSSAIGGEEAMPVVSRVEIPRGCVILLATDGLTKHVSNEEIAEQIKTMKSSEQLCRSLLDLALERGGSDNITLIAARAPIAAGNAD
ncbi:MAG TPA: protein phosphatase 2C domain-containing protein [Gemmatimonadales bacterium]|nr:protein phosphatase 2C domain-containing protein [Gemmatimonadales bacterium]HRZ09156.1 protein phosphatase 2C domain-containing protein [Gemmatimonadales bacterium]